MPPLMLPEPAGGDAVAVTDTMSDLEPLFADDDVNNGAFVRTVARTTPIYELACVTVSAQY